jgi:superfamily II DNA or RNA helicase
MPLAPACRGAFDAGSLKRGETYFRCGRVRLRETSGCYVSAEVEGTSENAYEVQIDWTDAEEGIVQAFCDCPRYADGSLCKHVWATIQAIDARNLASDVPRHTALDVLHENDGDQPDVWESWDDGENDDGESDDGGDDHRVASDLPARAGPTGGYTQFPPRPAKPRRPVVTWRTQLAGALGMPPEDLAGFVARRPTRPARFREAWYVVDASASRQAGELLIDLFQRERLKRGGFGKLKRITVRRSEVPGFPNAEDREVLQLLLGSEPQVTYGSYYYSYSGYDHIGYARCKVPALLHDLLLPRLCATGRFVWKLNADLPAEDGRRCVWDGGEPWRFRLRIVADDARQCWRLQGELHRGAETAPLESAVLLLASGLVLFPETLARLDAGDALGWMQTLRAQPAIEIPFADRRELLETLWSAPHLPPLELPAGLGVEVTEGTPQGRLMIRAPQRSPNMNLLYGQLEFRYSDWTVRRETPARAIVDADANRVVLRSPAHEQRLLEELFAAGVRELTGYVRERADVQLSRQALPQVVRTLTNQGWLVECEGRLIRRPGSWHLSVNSSVDWFELSGGVEFDGVTVPLPKLLAAVRKNENYVRLDDGTHGLLPEEWLERFGGLAELGETSGTVLKFTQSQALLLDALVAAQPQVEVDTHFQEVRQKLHSFRGVQPASAPDTFVGVLRGYQGEGLGWLHFLREFNFGGCLADDMGLGKTVQVLALLEARRTRTLADGETRAPSLVVVPKSLVFNWIEEAARFTPQLRVLNYTGGERADQLERLADYDLVVTTYGTLRRDIVSLREHWFDYAILDESQAIKNAQAQTAKACRLVRARHRLAMTGTPVENHLGELWSLFEFLNPGMLGRSQTFSSLIKGRCDGDTESVQLLAQGLRPFLLRRTKGQVLTELPEKTEQTLYCEMEPRQRKLYDELRDYYRASLSQEVAAQGLNKAKIHVLEALLRLRQAACHPGLVDRHRAGEPSAKLELLQEQIDEVLAEGHKALVFSQFTSLLAIVREQFDKRRITYEYLDGQTQDRGDRVKRFQEDPQCPLFLISLKAGGHGLNLTAADYVFILDPWWNPAVEAQAIDRAHRLGQSRRVFAYRIICRDTVEDKILELQREKRELADAIVSADNSLIRNLTADDLQRLLS